MACPICDQKPMNCDCTETERRQYFEMEELQERLASHTLTNAERHAIDYAAYFLSMAEAEQRHVPVLKNLLVRFSVGSGDENK